MQQKGKVDIIQDLFNARVYLSLKGDYLVGVMNASDENVAVEYIGKVLEKIGQR